MRLVPDSWGTRRLREFNQCHLPKGPGGGQFARKGAGGCEGGGSAPSSDKGAPRDRQITDVDQRRYRWTQMQQIAYTIIRLTGKGDAEGTEKRLAALDKMGYGYFKAQYATLLNSQSIRSTVRSAFPLLTPDEISMVQDDIQTLQMNQRMLDEGDGAWSDPEPARDEGTTAKTGAQVREDVLRVAAGLAAEVEYARARHRGAEVAFTRASTHKENLRDDLRRDGLDWSGLPMYFIGDTIKGRKDPPSPEVLDQWLTDPSVSEEVRDNRKSALANFEEAGDNLQRLSVAMYKATEDIKTAREAQREGLNKVLFLPEHLRMAAPTFKAMADIYGSKTVLKNQQKALDAAATWFAGMVSHDHGARYAAVMNVQKAKGRLSSRAFASAWSTSIGINKFTGQSVLVHELTHHLEFNDAATLQASVDFRDARVKGETEEVKLMTLQPGRGYGRDEIVRKGSDTLFRSVYAGKMYKGEGGRNEKTAYDFVGVPHNATEVLTMGMQFLHEDAAKFARDDPDWFDWTVDVVRHGPKFAMRNIKAHVPKTPPLRVNVGTARRLSW